MHQAVENTAYCLSCTHQWPTTWDLTKEATLVCPKCQWRTSVSKEFGVSSGGWVRQEVVEQRFEGYFEAQEVEEVAADKLLELGLRRKGAVTLGTSLLLASLLIIILVALGLISV
jgi:hypothetical protein